MCDPSPLSSLPAVMVVPPYFSFFFLYSARHRACDCGQAEGRKREFYQIWCVPKHSNMQGIASYSYFGEK